MIWIITYLALVFIGLGVAAAKHGEPCTGCYSIWTDLFGSALSLFIHYKGNFFVPIFG